MKIKVGQIWYDGENLFLITAKGWEIKTRGIRIFHERVDDLTVRWTTDVSIQCRFYIGEI